MENYERMALYELESWKKKMLQKAGVFNRLSKRAQLKMNGVIPEKVHKVITESMKNLIKTTLTGSAYMTKEKEVGLKSLEEKEVMLTEAMSSYRKTATIEGAGTGAGGIFLGMVDFPLLLGIKMKFLFETASIYGYDVKEYEERLFILHVFQLAFSSDEKRLETLEVIENWEERKALLIDMDWHVFQQEYRDYIDLVKMLQLIPGIGAVVGAYANYNLIEHLGDTAKNCYRMRHFSNEKQ